MQLNYGDVYISDGNTKLGEIPSVSLLPGVTCRSCVPCLRQCYARGIMERYPNVWYSWERNTTAYRDNSVQFFMAIAAYLTKNQPSYFRWHVGGDIPDYPYLQGMVATAQMFPGIRFRCFTKQYPVVLRAQALPRNLNIGISVWPGDTEIEDRIPELGTKFSFAITTLPKVKPGPRVEELLSGPTKSCAHNCDKCHICWSMRPGEAVVFPLHR